MTPVESREWVEERMIPFYPLGDYKVSSAVADLKK
jgi:2-oxoglutarate ferredoxin oxidoreductase subunit beta